MSADLRGALARRLLAAFGDRAVTTTPAGYHWEHVADECIRQMEWARHQTIETVIAAMDSGRSNPIAGPIIRAGTPDPLTLAPDDWEPGYTPQEIAQKEAISSMLREPDKETK